MVLMMVRGENNRGQNKLLWEEEIVYAVVTPKCSQGTSLDVTVMSQIWFGGAAQAKGTLRICRDE